MSGFKREHIIALVVLGAFVFAIAIGVVFATSDKSKAPSRVHWDDQLAKESVRPRPQAVAQQHQAQSPQDAVKAKFQQAFRYYVEQGMDPEEAKDAAMNAIRPRQQQQQQRRPAPEPEGVESVSLKDDGKVSEDDVREFWERRNRGMERVAAMNGSAPPQPAGAQRDVDSSVYLLKEFA